MSDSGPSPVASRPGQTYFVPGVRVLRLNRMPHPGPDFEAEEIVELRQDIISVSVTRPATGAAQYCITLNNWFDSLPRDRAKGVGPREQIAVGGGQPVWPRFKYNDFQVLDFGMRLRIDMRYFPDPETTLATTDQQAQRWVPMVSGPVSDMRFTFSDRDGARLEVCGEDDLCLLKNKNPRKVDYWARPEKEIIDDVLRRANFPLPLAPPAIPWPTFTESTAKAIAEAHFEGQSYLDYLMKFAERWDFEVFVEYVTLDDPNSGQQLHFEPSRCRTPPDQTLREVYLVERGKNLVEFNPEIRLVAQWTSVTFSGHDHSWQNPAMIQATIPPAPNPLPPWPSPPPSPDPLADELHIDAARGDEPLVSGPEWRRRKFGLNPHTEINQRSIDAERAQVMADAFYRKRAREFLKVGTVTVGLPRLRAGRHVEYRGMRPPFDGFYYVEKSEHTYGDEGLRTHFTARRPGMPFRPTDGT
ncbi:MAG TPA: hypothetical protein VHY35_24720 [Stellaceae bacterium]|jgi:hypothetical protein|nr:hypothetical protein [Stellaceae bacterium]